MLTIDHGSDPGSWADALRFPPWNGRVLDESAPTDRSATAHSRVTEPDTAESQPARAAVPMRHERSGDGYRAASTLALHGVAKRKAASRAFHRAMRKALGLPAAPEFEDC